MKRLIIVFTLALVGSNAFGQHWQRIGPTRVTQIRVPYFIDSNYGFTFQPGFVVFYADPSTPNMVYAKSFLQRTANGGGTWDYISFFDSLGIAISQLCFVSPSHGFAATASPDPNSPSISGLFETEDSGDHWKKISLPLDSIRVYSFTGVYATSGVIFASSTFIGNHNNGEATGPIFTSRDRGITWKSLDTVEGLFVTSDITFQNIYGNRDSLVATVYLEPYDKVTQTRVIHIVYSSDLGNTWHSEIIDNSYKGHNGLALN